jgi:hypothetical protein
MSYPINNFFTRSFTHSDVTVGTSAASALAALAQPGRRIHLLIQNQHASAVVEVILNGTGSEGFNLAAGATFSIEGYNGEVRLKSDTAATPVHIAYAVA